jgi:hypothetical protein
MTANWQLLVENSMGRLFRERPAVLDLETLRPHGMRAACQTRAGADHRHATPRFMMPSPEACGD